MRFTAFFNASASRLFDRLNVSQEKAQERWEKKEYRKYSSMQFFRFHERGSNDRVSRDAWTSFVRRIGEVACQRQIKISRCCVKFTARSSPETFRGLARSAVQKLFKNAALTSLVKFPLWLACICYDLPWFVYKLSCRYYLRQMTLSRKTFPRQALHWHSLRLIFSSFLLFFFNRFANPGFVRALPRACCLLELLLLFYYYSLLLQRLYLLQFVIVEATVAQTDSNPTLVKPIAIGHTTNHSETILILWDALKRITSRFAERTLSPLRSVSCAESPRWHSCAVCAKYRKTCDRCKHRFHGRSRG